MDPQMIQFWLVTGVATIMTITSSTLLAKLKSLKKNRSTEEQDKETQISGFQNRFTSLQGELTKTKRDFAEAKSEISDLKDIEATANTEVCQLKKFLEVVSKERDRLNKENATQKETMPRQQKELEQTIAQRSNLQDALQEKEQLIQKLQDTNQDMTAKIEELESNITELRQDKEVNQETISGQQQDLEQAITQRSELQDELKEKEQRLHRLQNSNRTITVKIEELESNIAKLRQDKEVSQETISRQQQELEQTIIQGSELQDELKELRDINHRMTAKIQELELYLKGLKEENEAKQENISHRQQELEQILNQNTELQDTLQEQEQLTQKFQDASQDMTAKIEELESNVAKLRQDKEINQETISGQQQELKQAIAQRSEFQDELKEKEQHLCRLQNANRGITAKIQELESNITELRQDKGVNQETISRQQQELEQAIIQRSELRDELKEKEQHLCRFQNDNRGVTAKIQELESNITELRQDKGVNQETISRQQQELEQAIIQRSELRDELKEKEQHLCRFQNDNRGVTAKIEELESNITELRQDKGVNQETISRQQQDLEQAIIQRSELQDELKEKEQHIQKLQDADHTMSAKFKKAQSQIQGLEKGTQAQSIIIAELKKECEAKKSQNTEVESAAEEKNESEAKEVSKEIKLEEVLLENKLITKETLQKALEVREKHGRNLLQFLFVNRNINENQLVERLSDKLGIPHLPLGTYEISKEIVKMVPSELVEEYWVLPVDKVKNILMIVMVDPLDNAAIKAIEKATGCTVRVYIGLLSEIAERIQHLYKINIRGLDAEGNLVSPLFIKTGTYKGRHQGRAVRFKAELGVRVIHDNSVDISTTEDISLDGLSFKLGHELPINSKVTIQLSMPESEDEQVSQLPVMAVAQVGRATLLENNNFMTDVEFLKIPKEDIYAIIERVSDGQNNKESEASDESNMPPELLGSEALQEIAKL